MSFFNATPTGRIVNRFTKDTTALDVNVPNAIQSFLSCFGAQLLNECEMYPRMLVQVSEHYNL